MDYIPSVGDTCVFNSSELKLIIWKRGDELCELVTDSKHWVNWLNPYDFNENDFIGPNLYFPTSTSKLLDFKNTRMVLLEKTLDRIVPEPWYKGIIENGRPLEQFAPPFAL